MNLATLLQNQSLATLLQALAPASDLAIGKTVEASLLSLDGDGLATALVGDTKIALVLAGPEARQAALQPGATLVLRFDAPAETGAPLRATLLDVRSPAVPASAPVATASPSLAATSPLPSQGGRLPPLVPAPGTAGPAPQIAAAPVSGAAHPAVVSTVQTPAATATPLPATMPPRAQAGPLLGQALARQDSLAPLLANLGKLADGSISRGMPRAVFAAASQILAQTVPAERAPITAQILKDAVQGSGLFLEARQAAGRPQASNGDLKASLQALRDSLAPVVDGLAARQTAKTPASDMPSPRLQDGSDPRPAPPRRDGPLALQPIAEPTLTGADGPLSVARTLLDQTDAALDRVSLSQFASLPPDTPRPDQIQRWLTEIPLAFQAGVTMLPLQIEKEPPRREVNGIGAPLWRIRFALDIEPMGPLQGVVTLQGRSVGVTLWAEREETSRLLRGATPGLEAALVDAAFENGTIDIHTGQPRIAQPTAGQFLDRMS